MRSTSPVYLVFNLVNKNIFKLLYIFESEKGNLDTLGHVGFVVLDRSCFLVSLVKDHESLCREGSRARAVGSRGKRQLSWGNGDLPPWFPRTAPSWTDAPLVPMAEELPHAGSDQRQRLQGHCGGARQSFQTLGSLGSRGYYQWGHVLHCLQPSVLSDARASESPIWQELEFLAQHFLIFKWE